MRTLSDHNSEATATLVAEYDYHNVEGVQVEQIHSEESPLAKKRHRRCRRRLRMLAGAIAGAIVGAAALCSPCGVVAIATGGAWAARAVSKYGEQRKDVCTATGDAFPGMKAIYTLTHIETPPWYSM